jgi:YidC/Oxa1 family membrane protein insertase
MRSMKAMQALAPQVNALRSKYQKDPQTLQRETLALYKKHRVNPMGGCLPMIAQVPIFYALYLALSVSVELQNSPFLCFARDVFGADLWICDWRPRSTYVLPVLMGVTMFVQQKMTPTMGDPRQAKMMLFMPVIFTFHVPQSSVGSRALLDGLQRPADPAAEAHGTDPRARARRARPKTPAEPEPPRADDTIVAIATALGESAIGVIRVSGPDAIAIVAPLLRSAIPLAAFPSHALRRVAIADAKSGERVDDALCAVMQAPRSYTGEDVVELSCHGSPIACASVTQWIAPAARVWRSRASSPRRAFCNGRIDLAQAEAVALMIGSAHRARGRARARALAGGFSERVRALRDQLVEVIAGLEVVLDFPTSASRATIDAARGAIERLAPTWIAGARGASGPRRHVESRCASSAHRTPASRAC